MGYTPKQLDGNVNVSRTHPLIELAWLIAGLVVVVGLTFLLLGLSADWAISKIPISVETWIGQLALDEFSTAENKALEKRLQALLATLPEDSPLDQYDFHVFLDVSDTINAIALPGGNIVVYKGLLKQIKSENELSMVLAHELGHFAHRDHLRGLGRGLGITLATTLLFGQESAASSLIAKSLLTFQTKYSRQQESAADQFGLDLLVRRYGHAGGATDFFSHVAATAGSKIPYFLASHPHPQDRVDALNRQIREKHYRVSATQLLKNDLLPTPPEAAHNEHP